MFPSDVGIRDNKVSLFLFLKIVVVVEGRRNCVSVSVSAQGWRNLSRFEKVAIE